MKTEKKNTILPRVGTSGDDGIAMDTERSDTVEDEFGLSTETAK